MKVPPKRKGNLELGLNWDGKRTALNESPSEKEGKFSGQGGIIQANTPSMKVPPKRKGNPATAFVLPYIYSPSMKVPPKRKGNNQLQASQCQC